MNNEIEKDNIINKLNNSNDMLIVEEDGLIGNSLNN